MTFARTRESPFDCCDSAGRTPLIYVALVGSVPAALRPSTVVYHDDATLADYDFELRWSFYSAQMRPNAKLIQVWFLILIASFAGCFTVFLKPSDGLTRSMWMRKTTRRSRRKKRMELVPPRFHVGLPQFVFVKINFWLVYEPQWLSFTIILMEK